MPIVYPIIIYASKNQYSHSTDLFDLFNNKELAKDILWQPYKLIDLTQTPDAKLQQYLWYGTLARVMKHIFDADMHPTLKAIIKELKIIENQGELDYIYTTFSYIFEAGDIKDFEGFRKMVKAELSEKDEENIMTLANRLRQEGKQEGKQEALKAVALTLLKKKKPAAEVEEVTGLPAKTIEELEFEMN